MLNQVESEITDDYLGTDIRTSLNHNLTGQIAQIKRKWNNSLLTGRIILTQKSLYFLIAHIQIDSEFVFPFLSAYRKKKNFKSTWLSKRWWKILRRQPNALYWEKLGRPCLLKKVPRLTESSLQGFLPRKVPNRSKMKKNLTWFK